MHRARVRIALIVLVLSALIGIGFLIGRTMLRQQRVAERTAETMLAPDIAQSIRQFHRVKVEEGRTVWDLRADKADFLDEGRVMVEVPELAFFADDGQSVQLSGAEGEVLLDGPDVDRIDLRGGIEVSVGQYRLETPEASWVGALNTVVAPSGVDLRGDGVQLTGDTMIIELETRRVFVVGKVRTVLTRAASEAEAEAEAEAEGEGDGDGALVDSPEAEGESAAAESAGAADAEPTSAEGRDERALEESATSDSVEPGDEPSDPEVPHAS